MASISRAFTDAQLASIIERKNNGATYERIVDFLAKQYGISVSPHAVQRAYLKYRHLFDVAPGISSVKTLQEIARVKRSNSHTAKQNRVILDALNEQQDVLEQVREAVRGIGKIRVAHVKAPKKDSSKPDMTVEALVSDVHIGKLTSTFNVEVCRQRLRQYSALIVAEIKRKSAHYNVERIIIPFLGDNIENATMHGVESMRGCEFGNPEQVRYAIELFFSEVLAPVAVLGIPIDVIGIAGNHCRTDEKKTFQMPGKNALSWVIYQTLKLLCEKAGLKHVNWTIPEGAYAVYEVYGASILAEHGDNIAGGDKKAFLSHMAKRGAQLGILLKGIRLGHWHEYSCHDNGRAIVNGSVCGGDSYADVLGFTSVPVQVITFYVRTKNRDTPYYYSLPVYLNAGGGE